MKPTVAYVMQHLALIVGCALAILVALSDLERGSAWLTKPGDLALLLAGFGGLGLKVSGVILGAS